MVSVIKCFPPANRRGAVNDDMLDMNVSADAARMPGRSSGGHPDERTPLSAPEPG